MLHSADPGVEQVYASWPAVLLGLLGVLAGLIGNIVYTPEILQYFAIYFSVTVPSPLLLLLLLPLTDARCSGASGNAHVRSHPPPQVPPLLPEEHAMLRVLHAVHPPSDPQNQLPADHILRKGKSALS
jgi:hypothetical protein